MKKITSIIWGIILVAVGVVVALNALDITDFSVFFDGWWTVFIIVPCAVGVFTERDKIGNLMGVALGVFLLLCCQDVLSFSLLWKLLIPAFVVVIGIKLIVKGFRKDSKPEIIIEIDGDEETSSSEIAVFSGTYKNYSGQVFEGANLVAVFGGVDCDLRNAIIEKDCKIKTAVVFGGADILVPENVNVKVDTCCIFGGVSNKTKTYPDAPTIYVSGACLFGGIEVK